MDTMREILSLKFDGMAIENGEIDIRDLAPALLALSDIFQISGKVLNGDNSKVSVKVSATKKGSFEVSLVIAQTFLEQAKALFDFAAQSKDGIGATKDLVDIIWKVGATILAIPSVAYVGLMGFLKWQQNRSITKIEYKDNELVWVYINDEFIQTTKATLKLVQSVDVRESVEKFTSVIEKQGIDRISIGTKQQDAFNITKNDAAYYRLPVQEELVNEDTKEVYLTIVSLSFKEDNKWRVSDGYIEFPVLIEDIAFLNSIANNEVSFSKGDKLKCLIKERQFAGLRKLRKEFSIIKVIEHKSGAQQLNLI